MSHADKVIEAIKAMTPEERVQSLISAGIIREDGTLMPQYGGTSTSGDIPTPETDAEQRQFGIGENRMYISAGFARDLERRLAAATEEVKLTAIRCSNLEEAISAIMPSEELTALVASLRAELAAATARAEEAERELTAERFEYCEECNFPLSDCGEPNPDGTPSVDCMACQLVSKLTDLSTEVDRLRKEREWQPIETAPKDGSYILATNPQSAGVWVVMYEEVFQSGYKPENPWRSMMLNHNHISTRHASTKPTHWMPLPDAPKQEEGEAPLSAEQAAYTRSVAKLTKEMLDHETTKTRLTAAEAQLAECQKERDEALRDRDLNAEAHVQAVSALILAQTGEENL